MSNDTDRELLERAAKAAGLRINFHPTASYKWNPLMNDGDALRLAVKLGLRVDIGWDKYTLVDWEARDEDDEPGEVEQTFDGDPYAATRRAIVRAAAEIGGE